FSDFPLEMYLTDVPDDKVIVLTNMRSAFSNTFLVRNNDVGRELMRDWMGIIESGLMQCHGWDQAALETLLISRMRDGRFPETPTPFNHTCLHSKWAKDPSLSRRFSQEALAQLERTPGDWDW
ncbi:unnamed protein product, partial [Symbiodinium microadriaticum]